MRGPSDIVLVVGVGDSRLALTHSAIQQCKSEIIRPGPEPYVLEMVHKFPDVSIPDKQLTPIEYARTLKKSRRVK